MPTNQHLSKPELHKVVFHHKWTSAPDRIAYWSLVWVGVVEWLTGNGKQRHYLNHYVNVDYANRTSEMVVVLNDLTTALMLKLALA